jgi:hypothetical protein
MFYGISGTGIKLMTSYLDLTKGFWLHQLQGTPRKKWTFMLSRAQELN